MFRLISKCLEKNHQKLSQFTEPPKLGTKVGYQGLFGVSNHEMQSYLPFMRELSDTGHSVFRTFRVIAGFITPTSIDISTLLIFLDVPDETISALKKKIYLFCDSRPGLNPNNLDIHVKCTKHSDVISLDLDFTAYGQTLEEHVSMPDTFTINVNWLTQMDRTAFDIAFDSPLMVCYVFFEIVKSGIQNKRVGIAFNTSFGKLTCKSIASNFIAGICLYASGNVVPHHRVINELTLRVISKEKTKCRFMLWITEELAGNLPVIVLSVETSNKEGVIKNLTILKTNAALTADNKVAPYKATFTLPAKQESIIRENKQIIKPGVVLKLDTNAKETLDRVFDLNSKNSLVKNIDLHYGYWYSFEEDNLSRSCLYNVETGEKCVDLEYDVYNDVINALVSPREAVVPPAVVYFDEDDDWTLSLNYHRLFILFNKLLSLGIRRIEIKDQYGDPFKLATKFISSYSDYQSDRATVRITSVVFTFQDKSRTGHVTIFHV